MLSLLRAPGPVSVSWNTEDSVQPDFTVLFNAPGNTIQKKQGRSQEGIMKVSYRQAEYPCWRPYQIGRETHLIEKGTSSLRKPSCALVFHFSMLLYILIFCQLVCTGIQLHCPY